MYLHIGADYVIRTEEIIAIIDVKNHQPSQLSGQLITIDEFDQKSYVITDTKEFLSPISAATLKKRMEISLS